MMDEKSQQVLSKILAEKMSEALGRAVMEGIGGNLESSNLLNGYTATQAHPDDSDIMADLEKIYKQLMDQPRYEVWVSKALNFMDGKTGFIVDCNKIGDNLSSRLPTSTHIIVIPEKWFEVNRDEVLAAHLPVFDAGGKRIA